jgi:uncharacterized delta-60 repeat protein
MDGAMSVAIAPSGKIIVAGVTGNDFALACYNPDGYLDASFGSLGNGKVITDFTAPFSRNGAYGSAYSVAITPNGNIIVVGKTDDYDSDYALACYTQLGVLNTSFGLNGKVTSNATSVKIIYNGVEIDYPNSSEYAFSVSIDKKSGNIIVAGTTFQTNVVNPHFNFVLACYYGDNNAVPISNICFPANTQITTNQGTIAIQNLDPNHSQQKN